MPDNSAITREQSPAISPTAVNPTVISPATEPDSADSMDKMNGLLQSAMVACQFQNEEGARQASLLARALYAQAKMAAAQTDALVLGLMQNLICLFEPLTRCLVRQLEGEFDQALMEIDGALKLAEQSLKAVADYAAIPNCDPDIVNFLEPMFSVFPIMFQGLGANLRADIVGYEGKIGEYVRLLREAVAEFRRVNDLPPTDNQVSIQLTGLCVALADRLGRRADSFSKKPVPQYLAPSGNKIFIIHGQNEAKWRELADLLRNRFHQEVVVLEEQVDSGMTVIEKFTNYAKGCCYAFALLTPDDFVKKGKLSTLQARPNVLFEIGWFYGRLGRDRVTLCLQKGTAIPSDLSGIVRLEFADSVADKFTSIQDELKRIGLTGELDRASAKTAT